MQETPSRRARAWVWVGAAAALLALGACSRQDAESAPAAPAQQAAVAVVTAVAVVEPMGIEIEAIGTAYANESVEITSKASNVIVSIGFEEGSLVRRGDVLVELDSAEAKASLAEAQRPPSRKARARTSAAASCTEAR